MIFIQLCLKKIVQICEMLGYFHAPWLLQSCPSTKGRYYSGESDLLRIFLWDYSVCWLQESWSCPASPLSPNTRCVKEHPCFFTHPFFCPPLYPLGLGSHQMVSARHDVSFVLLPTQYRVRPHLRVSLYILHLLKSPQKCSSFSMGCGLCCPLEDSNKAVRMNFLGSSYICFQIQSLNYYFPRSHPSFIW